MLFNINNNPGCIYFNNFGIPTIQRMARKSVFACLKLTVIAVAALLSAGCQRTPVVSLRTLLAEMTDRESLSEFPDAVYQVKQFSSYDRRTIHPDSAGWFANNDYTHFIREELTDGRQEFVMFEDEGPGAVVRWWMTFAGEGAHEGIVRIYIDGVQVPVIESQPLPLLSGQLLAGYPLSSSVSPLTDTLRRGHNLYLPIPYARSCKITYESDAVEITPERRKPSIYYNINYRKYTGRVKVVPFSMDELEHSRLLIEETNRLLLSEPDERKHTSVSRISGILSEGDTLELLYSGRNEAISMISVRLTARNQPQALRSVVLMASFDDIQTVWVPVGEFFGSGYKRTNSATFFSTADSTCYFESFRVMPFRKDCKIALVNFGQGGVRAELSAYYQKKKWTDNTMYFGASWHEYHNIMAAGAEVTGGTGRHTDLSFIEIGGRGVYAGDAVTVYNTVDAWWGEGDEKIFVDGEEFPSSIGTGTEDYYGYAWCRPELFSHPFIAQPSGDGNFHPGQTINLRYRCLDAIPFQESISSNMELWHWVPAIINYSLTTWYYFLPPVTINITPNPAVVRNPVPRTKEDLLPLPKL